MADRSERLLRQRGAPESASFLELFFDLAFILALAQLARGLLDDLSVGGALRTALLLAPSWWIWVVTTWSADWYDPRDREVRVLLVGSALGALLMSVAIPQALDGRAVLFAGAYVTLHLGRGMIIVPTLRGHPLQRRSLRILMWYVVTAVPWLVGAFVPAARIPAWTLGVLLDYAGPALGWPFPGLGRAQPDELRLVGGHLSERFQQVFIIALGELVLVAGLAYAGTGTGLPQTAAFLLTFATAVLVGLLYVTPAGVHLGPAIARSANPARLSTITTYLHLLMIAGVIASAVGGELAIAHPTGRGPATGMAFIVAGPSLFLAGRLLQSVAINRRLSWSRLGALLAMIATALVAARLPLLAVSAVTTALLFAVAATDRTSVVAPGRP